MKELLYRFFPAIIICWLLSPCKGGKVVNATCYTDKVCRMYGDCCIKSQWSADDQGHWNLSCCVCKENVHLCEQLNEIRQSTSSSGKGFMPPLSRENSPGGTNPMVSTVSISERYFRDVSIILSTMFLFFCIVVYASNDRLFDHVGKSIVSFCFSLILCAICKLIIPILRSPSLECQLASVTFHFCQLYSYTTGSIFMLSLFWHCHLLRTNRDSRSKGPLKEKYHIGVAILVPAIIISVSASLDFSDRSSHHTPGYGGKTCWMDHVLGTILWLTLPATLLEISNIILLWLVFSAYRGMESRFKEDDQRKKILMSNYFNLGLRFNVIVFFEILASALEMIVQDTLLRSIFRGYIHLVGIFLAIVFMLLETVRSSVRISKHSIVSLHPAFQEVMLETIRMDHYQTRFAPKADQQETSPWQN